MPSAMAGELENKLIDAAKWSNADVVLPLLAQGANVNAKDSNGRTALMHAAVMGRADVVRVLLGKGANAKREG